MKAQKNTLYIARFTGVFVLFWLNTMTTRRFIRVPTINVWNENTENITDYQEKNDIPTIKTRIILHRYVI